MLIQLSKIFRLHFWSIQCNRGKDSYEILEGFWAFPHPEGTKSWFCPRNNAHIALLLSKMECLMKNSKSCSKVIQRTLRSGKSWLRYSLFSVISRVKSLNLRTWPNFRAHFESPTHTGKTRQCAQKKCARQKSLKWIAMDCARQSTWKMCNFHLKMFSWRMFFVCLKIGILPLKTPFPRMKFCYFSPNFGRPPSGARISINFKVEWTSPHFSLEMWQGFCHPKIIPYKNVPSKRPFYTSNFREVLLFFPLLFFFLVLNPHS